MDGAELGAFDSMSLTFYLRLISIVRFITLILVYDFDIRRDIRWVDGVGAGEREPMMISDEVYTEGV